MKARIWVIIVFSSLFCMALMAADEKVDFSGTWVLDKSKSDPVRFGMRGPGGGGGQASDIDIALTIKQTDNELNITRKVTFNGQDRSIDQKFSLDGTENINTGMMGRGEFKSKTNWKKEKLVTEGTQQVTTPNGEFEMGIREEYWLSEDGKVLTIKATRSTPMGENSSKQVFNKQP